MANHNNTEKKKKIVGFGVYSSYAFQVHRLNRQISWIWKKKKKLTFEPHTYIGGQKFAFYYCMQCLRKK